METTLHTLLAQGVDALGLTVADTAIESLLAYTRLLARWNRAYNLTAVRDPEDMVVKHILDSLSILPWLQGPRLVDVGSGAGLPGIPLAVVRADLNFVLLDSNGKRTRFLTQAVAELGLRQVNVVRARAEDYDPKVLFDSVLARAFASLGDFVRRAGRLCATGGRILAMKGTFPGEELAALPAGYQVLGVYPLRVPGLAAERHLVHIAPTDHPARTSAWPISSR